MQAKRDGYGIGADVRVRAKHLVWSNLGAAAEIGRAQLFMALAALRHVRLRSARFLHTWTDAKGGAWPSTTVPAAGSVERAASVLALVPPWQSPAMCASRREWQQCARAHCPCACSFVPLMKQLAERGFNSLCVRRSPARRDRDR